MAWLVPWVANCFVLSLFAKKRIIPRSQQQTKSFQDIEPKVLFSAGKSKKLGLFWPKSRFRFGGI